MLLNFPNLHSHAAQPEREKDLESALTKRESKSRNAARGKSEWKIALQIFIKHQCFLLFCLFLSASSSLYPPTLFDCMRLQFVWVLPAWRLSCCACCSASHYFSFQRLGSCSPTLFAALTFVLLLLLLLLLASCCCFCCVRFHSVSWVRGVRFSFALAQ